MSQRVCPHCGKRCREFNDDLVCRQRSQENTLRQRARRLRMRKWLAERYHLWANIVGCDSSLVGFWNDAQLKELARQARVDGFYSPNTSEADVRSCLRRVVERMPRKVDSIGTVR